MTRRAVVVSAVLANLTGLLSAAPVVLAQQAVPLRLPDPAGEAVILMLPGQIETGACQVHSFLIGPFGGYGNGASAVSGPTYRLPIAVDGVRGRTLKAFVYCRGYAIHLITLPTLDRLPTRIPVELTRVRTLKLTGRLVLPPGRGSPVNLRLSYLADWSHGFFGIIDGMVPTIEIAVVAPERDGTFSFEVPDFLSDPVVLGFQHRGSLLLMAVHPVTLNNEYALSIEGQGDAWPSIPVAGRYAPLVVHARPRHDAAK